MNIALCYLLHLLGGLGGTLGGAPGAADPTELVGPLLAESSLIETLVHATRDTDEGSPFSYTYIEVGATEYDIDNISDDADIYFIKASLALGMFHLIAGYENQDLDFNNTSSDLLSLGAGLHFNLAPTLDVAGDVSWLFNDVDSDLSSLDDSNTGYVIRAGPRWMPFDWSGGGLELTAEALWIDLENRIASEDEAFGYGLGGRVHFIEFLSVGANYTILEDDDAISVNARVSF